MQLDKSPLVGVPKSGVVRLGDVANTSKPEPVSSVMAVARLALDDAPSHVAMPDASDVMPVPPEPAGSVPDTSVASDTAPKVGAPPALPCRTVVVVPSEAIGVGAAPAPPPKTRALAVSAPDDVIADDEL